MNISLIRIEHGLYCVVWPFVHSVANGAIRSIRRRRGIAPGMSESNDFLFPRAQHLSRHWLFKRATVCTVQSLPS